MSWTEAKRIMGDGRVLLGPQASHQWIHDPKHLLFVLARYKHAARLIGDHGTVLEVGCGEGIGARILAAGRRYVGIDPDAAAVEVADDVSGGELEFLPFGLTTLAPSMMADAVVSLDVIEHIAPTEQPRFVRRLADRLPPHGVCVVGTPNANAASYQSPASLAGHVGLLAHDDLRALMREHFEVVQLFGMNDEVLHTGYLPMAHYLMAVGIMPR